jgi:hypothetical protein
MGQIQASADWSDNSGATELKVLERIRNQKVYRKMGHALRGSRSRTARLNIRSFLHLPHSETEFEFHESVEEGQQQ